MSNVSIYDALASLDEGWDDAWKVRADEWISWVEQHGRFPNYRSADPVERRLAQWISTQREAMRGLGGRRWSAEREAYLDANAPHWRIGHEPAWRLAADACAAWVRDHGQLPGYRATDPEEKRFGVWLRVQVESARGTRTSSWSAGREAYLDEHLPRWREVCSTRPGAPGKRS